MTAEQPRHWFDSATDILRPLRFLREGSCIATVQQDLSTCWYSTVYAIGEQVWGSPLCQTEMDARSAAEKYLDARANRQ